MLFTIGHGSVDEQTFSTRLSSAGVRLVVDVRRFPNSRRWPWFEASAMARWLSERGVDYVPAPLLGGRRKPRSDSANVALREPGFRGYADYMETPAFHEAFAGVLEPLLKRHAAVMCSETLWWRCHRRLIADYAVLVRGIPVTHIVGARLELHRPMPVARVVDGRALVYDQPSEG